MTPHLEHRPTAAGRTLAGRAVGDTAAAFQLVLRSGADDAIASLVRAHAGVLLALACRLLGNAEEGAAAVREAFAAAGSTSDDLGGLNGAAWLRRLVVRAALARLRARPDTGPIEAMLPSFAPDGHHADAERLATPCSFAGMRASVRAAIDRLPVEERAVLLLRDGETFDVQTTANLLEIDGHTVGSRLHRARMALRELLARCPA